MALNFQVQWEMLEKVSEIAGRMEKSEMTSADSYQLDKWTNFRVNVNDIL